MSTKYFTLIKGGELRPAPNQKIIRAEDFSILQSASELHDQIKQDAEEYRKDVAKECENVKEIAYKDGYEEGYKQWTEHLAEFEKKLEALQKELQQSIIPIALKAAKKIVGREIELSENTIVDIVASNLKSISQHKKIVVYVNKKELEVLEKSKPRLRELFESLESLSIRPRDDIDSGGCIIETEIGIINAQSEHRWRVLERAFDNLMKSTPDKLKES